MGIFRPVLRPILRPILNRFCDRYNQAGGGGVGPGDPGAAWAWLNGLKTWAVTVGSTSYSSKQVAGLGTLIKL